MSRLVPVLIAVAAVTSACSESSIPVAELTTSTSEPVSVVETEAPTTTEAVATSTTQEPTTTKPAQPERYNPETAQAEIAALIEDFEDFWTVDGDPAAIDPDDPRLEQIYTGEQLARTRTFFEDERAAGNVLYGTITVTLLPPAILFESRQHAEIAACQLDGLGALGPDGRTIAEPDQVAFRQFIQFEYLEGSWRISSKGKPQGENKPCDL